MDPPYVVKLDRLFNTVNPLLWVRVYLQQTDLCSVLEYPKPPLICGLGNILENKNVVRCTKCESTEQKFVPDISFSTI